MNAELKENQKQIFKTEHLPNHIAIIMDGNGRWAQKQGKPRYKGHYQGANTVKSIVKTCVEIKISILSLYAFSEENWNRPKNEIMNIFTIFNLFLQREITNLNKKN